MGEASEKVPCLEARSELFAVKRWAQQMTLEREVLADGTEAREESLRALGPAKTSHASLAFTGGLMAVLRAVVHPSAGLHEQVADVRKLRDLGLRGRIATQLVGDDLAWSLWGRRARA